MGINVWFLFQYCICSFGLPKLLCTFFWLDPKDQDRIRSFGLTQKNQKVKAHTPEATLSVAALKSRKTRLRLRQPRFFNAPLGRPLYASSVRPIHLLLKLSDWSLKIIGYENPSPLRGAPLKQGSYFKSKPKTSPVLGEVPEGRWG